MTFQVQLNSKFTPFWACPCHCSQTIEVTIYKLRTKMHLSPVQIPTNSGLDWKWSSIQFFYIRAPRATGAQRPSPAGSECSCNRPGQGANTLVIQNNTMQTIHAIRTLRTVCGFLDMGDGCCLIFNKNQLMFIVRKSITAQIKKKIILFFS